MVIVWRFVFLVYVVLCLFLVASTSAIDCLERLVSEMTYYVSSGTLNPTHSLTHSPFCTSDSAFADILRIYRFRLLG